MASDQKKRICIAVSLNSTEFYFISTARVTENFFFVTMCLVSRQWSMDLIENHIVYVNMALQTTVCILVFLIHPLPYFQKKTRNLVGKIFKTLSNKGWGWELREQDPKVVNHNEPDYANVGTTSFGSWTYVILPHSFLKYGGWLRSGIWFVRLQKTKPLVACFLYAGQSVKNYPGFYLPGKLERLPNSCLHISTQHPASFDAAATSFLNYKPFHGIFSALENEIFAAAG